MNFEWQYPGRMNIKPYLMNAIKAYLSGGPMTYIVIYGAPGNGKTQMVYEVAKEMDIDVYKFTADASYTQEDVDNAIKELNLIKATSSRENHVVLIDSFDEFMKKGSFMKFVKYSAFPVIFTCNELSCFGDWSFTKDSSCKKIKVEKLTPSILQQLLLRVRDEKNISMDDLAIYKLAREAPSVRKALLALEMGSACRDYEDRTNMYRQLQNRSLTFNLNYFQLKNIIDKIHRYDSAHTAILVRLAQYESLFTFDPFSNHAFSAYLDDNECLDKYFFNNINVPIEKYFPMFNKSKYTQKTKAKPKQKRKKQAVAETVTTHEDISSFL